MTSARDASGSARGRGAQRQVQSMREKEEGKIGMEGPIFKPGSSGIRMGAIAQRNGNTWSSTHEGAMYHNAQRIRGAQNPSNLKLCCKIQRQIQQHV